MFPDYDVIVVGAGHAGCEAAAAAANLGSKVLLVTMNMQTIAQMSCNPAMGGIAKGQIVREIDALGGYSGIVTDKSLLQFRMLNKSKGPAMWSPRAQNDRMLFSSTWRTMLEQTPNIDFYQDTVKTIIVKSNRVTGVVTGLGHNVFSKAVVITSGTFLNGIIHIGEKNFGGGRIAEKNATGITEQLVTLGFESSRLKQEHLHGLMEEALITPLWKYSMAMMRSMDSLIYQLKKLKPTNNYPVTLPIPIRKSMKP